MKKTLCLLLALLLALSLAALAEEAAVDTFSDTWVSLTEEGYACEIWYEDGAFACRGTRFITVDDGYSFEFDACAYDAAANTLVCTGGHLTHEVRGADDTLVPEEVASGFGATLSVDAEHRLTWTGSGDAIPDQTFASLYEVGEGDTWGEDGDDENDNPDDKFVGEWACERASLFIDEDDGVYLCTVMWGSSAWEETVWQYTCSLDPATGALVGVGTKSIDTYNDDGEFVSSEEEYSDGAVTFRLDGENLLWEDAKEDAGEGMRFETYEPEGDADEPFDAEEVG